MNYVGLDLSLAKSGVAVISVKDRKPTIELAYLITSDKGKESADRIEGTVVECRFLATKYNAAAVVKEAPIVGRSATAIPVIKTHGAFEAELSRRHDVYDVHGSTVKAWARVVTGSDGKRKDKQMVADAVEKYYGESVREVLYTPRGRLLDDVADAIALMTLWLEREGVIETKFKREKAVKK